MMLAAFVVGPALAQLFLAPAGAPLAAAPPAVVVPALPLPAAFGAVGEEPAVEAPLPAEPAPRAAAWLAFAALLGAAAAVRPRNGRRAPLTDAVARMPARGRRGPAAVLMAEGAKEESLSKDALVGAIAEKAGVSKKTAGLVLSATLDVIVDSVCQGSKVSFLGFGTFRAKERPAREVRNPRTGEKIAVDAKAVPTFSFGSKFKEAVKSRVQVSGS